MNNVAGPDKHAANVGDPDSPFPETADIETSSDEYATRFSGVAGEWMLEVQKRLTLGLLEEKRDLSILDVGGGHGQLAVPLAELGYKLTVLSSSESCRKRIDSIISTGKCDFVVGNVIELPFADKSFDVVIAFRMLTHCEKWSELISELCRVSRTAVIVDYPTSQSLNAVAPLFFEAKKKVELNTRSWRLFKHQQIFNEFAANGYFLDGRKGEFFLPMVLHRMLKNAKFSGFLEGICRWLGLTRLCGSPVIVKFVPKDAA